MMFFCDWRRLIRGVLLGLALILPVIFCLKTANPMSAKALTLQLGVLAAVVIWLLGSAYEGRFEILERAVPFLLPAALLAIWTAVRYAFSSYRMAGMDAFIKQEAFLITFMLTLLSFSRSDSRKILVAIFGGWSVVAVYGIMQYAGFDPFTWRGVEGKWAFSMLGLPSLFSSYLVLCTMLALPLTFDDENPAWLRCLSGVMAMISSYLCANDVFFAVLLVLAIILLFIVVRRGLGGTGRKVAIAVSAACVALCVLSAVRSKAVSNAGAEAEYRSTVWGSTFPLIKERPWLGSGPGSFVARFPAYRDWKTLLLTGQHALYVSHAHSEFLEQWVEGGVPGVLLWTWLCGILLWRGWKTLAARETGGDFASVAGLFASYAVSLGLMLLMPDSRYPAPGWLIYFIGGLLGASAVRHTDRTDAVFVLPFPYVRFRPLILVAVLAGAFFLASASVRAFLSDMWQYQAHVYRKSGKLEEALGAYNKVMRGSAPYVKSRYYIGIVYADRGLPGDHEAALRSFQEVRRMEPDFVRVHFEEAKVLEKLNRLPEALERMERQIYLDPIDPETWLKLAGLYEKTGDVIRAELSRRKAESARDLNRSTKMKSFHVVRL